MHRDHVRYLVGWVLGMLLDLEFDVRSEPMWSLIRDPPQPRDVGDGRGLLRAGDPPGTIAAGRGGAACH